MNFFDSVFYLQQFFRGSDGINLKKRKEERIKYNNARDARRGFGCVHEIGLANALALRFTFKIVKVDAGLK